MSRLISVLLVVAVMAVIPVRVPVARADAPDGLEDSDAAGAGWFLTPRVGVLMTKGTAATRTFAPAAGAELALFPHEVVGGQLGYTFAGLPRGGDDVGVLQLRHLLALRAAVRLRFHPAARLVLGAGGGLELLSARTQAFDDSRWAHRWASGISWSSAVEILLPAVAFRFSGQGLVQLNGRHEEQLTLGLVIPLGP